MGPLFPGVSIKPSNSLVVDTANDVNDGDTSSVAALLGNKGADGFISLREAIEATNNTANGGTPDEIHFNIADTDPGHLYYQDDAVANALTSVAVTSVSDAMIADFDPDHPYAPHSWFRIDLNSALPQLEINDAVIIDGYTQAGAAQNTLLVGNNAQLRIELTSSGADGNRGITVQTGGAGSSIFGLVINGFDGAEIMAEPGADNITVQGNFLGTDVSGTQALGDGDAGVHLRSSNNLVGGPNVEDRNVLSGNNSRGVATFTFGASGLNSAHPHPSPHVGFSDACDGQGDESRDRFSADRDASSLRRQYDRNPCRCHRMTVSGFTTISASCHLDHSR